MIPDLTDTTTWPDETLDALRVQVLSEQERRSNLVAIPQAMTALNQKYLTAEGIVAGSEWRAPSGGHDAYPLEFVVTHNGKTWTNLTPANVWEPGVSGWHEEVDDSSGPPDGVQPTGAHDAYNVGDRVTFAGSVYESLVNGNTWSPVAYPAGWQLIP